MSERTDSIRASVCSEWQTTRQIRDQSKFRGSTSLVYKTLGMMRKYHLVESRRAGTPDGMLEWRLAL